MMSPIPRFDLPARVQVYRNLNQPGVTWSVRDAQTGRVVAHEHSITLSDVRFHVQPAGQQRARREQVRNVHAYIAGHPVLDLPDLPWRAARYHPFTTDHFIDLRSGSRVPDGVMIRLDADGLCWADFGHRQP
jgi:hypothetical protein